MVPSRVEADGILSGTVNSYAVRPVTFGTGGRATEYEIVIGAQMLFTRADGEEVLWRQDRYYFRELYEANVSEAVSPSNVLCPVSISYSTQPNAHRSERLSDVRPRACSGLM